MSGDAPDEGEEEAKKAKTDDAKVTPTNGSVEPSDVPVMSKANIFSQQFAYASCCA